MVAPGGGVAVTHFQDVVYKLVDSSSGVSPDSVEDCEQVNVELCFYWQFPKQEIQAVGG